MRLSSNLCAVIACSLLLFASAAQAGATGAGPFGIVFGQVDDFEDETTMFWAEGGPSPNPPTVVLDGGPAGKGDAYLENISEGGVGPGSRCVMFNFVQWSGDYVAAGVDRIEADMANFGTSTLFMRLAVEGSFGQRWGSAAAAEIPADGAWHHVAFDLTEDGMDQVGGTQSLETVLSNVSELRILSAESGAAFTGDVIDATLGVDNILATAADFCDTTSACPDADVNCDDVADGFDIAVIRNGANWLMVTGAAAEPRADVNHDGVIDGFDIAAVRNGACWLQ